MKPVIKRRVKPVLIVTVLFFLLVLLVTVNTFSSFSFHDVITGFVSAIGGQNQPKNGLAKVFNGDKIQYDKAYAKTYLELHKNFSNIQFNRIFSDKEDLTFSMWNKVDDLKGIRTDVGKFVIHLVHCDEFEQYCKFRVNGVPTPRLYVPDAMDAEKTNIFNLDGTYLLTLKSAKFNQCDKKRFCHLGFEGYHIVEVSVERKR